MLKVNSEGGRTAEGSGFFAVEPGIVVTNAHVLGMLHPSSKPPTKVEVIVHSGSPTELKLSAKVLGVDRVSDVALLKVEGMLPSPMQFGKIDDLVETQKVYIFGFPFGSELGKNITVSESSVSSLRTDFRGELKQIQVNGGMHPGNSGGPVVNTKGEVIGVAVAGIRNTQINFAIPIHTVKSLFDGCILDVTAGEVVRDKSGVQVPLQYRCLDPLQRIREVRVEVWAGKPAENRGYSPKEAQTQPGDGPRQSYPLKFAKDTATGDIPLPKLKTGEVGWIQPVIVFTKGSPVWGTPRAFKSDLAIERIAANLNTNLAAQKDRTVQLKVSQSLTLSSGKKKYALAQSAELALLESFSSHPKGALVTVGFGPPSLTFEENGTKSRSSPDITSLVQRIPPRFVVDETNRLRERADVNLNPRLPLSVRETVGDFLTQICNGYEAATFVIPNRILKPRETWPVKLPLLLKTGTRPEVVDLLITCTLEGVRTTTDKSEAIVRFEGKVQSRVAREMLDGQVAGQLAFDIKHSFISSVKMTISSELSSPSSDLQAVFAFDVNLTRIEGNPRKISVPTRSTTPTPIVKKDILPAKPKGKEKNAGPVFSYKELFKKPSTSTTPTSYMKVVSQPGDFIGQGKTYDFPIDKLDIRVTYRGLTISVDGWILNVGGPAKEFIKVGEYPDAKRYAFSGDSPGLDFMGQGRGSNTLMGAFVVWELEVKDNKVVKLALDFEQHSEGKLLGLTGKIRINSSFK